MSRLDLTRRSLLAGGLAAGASASVFGGPESLTRLALAGSKEPHYYIFCYFSGGWDLFLSLDPRDPLVFTDELKSTTLIQPGYEFLNNRGTGHTTQPFTTPNGLYVGPYMGDLGTLHDDKLCIVRGMSMETLTHEAGRRRFLTGKPPSGLLARGSSGATWLASKLGAQDLIPNLSVGVESYNTSQPAYASAMKVNSVPDLVRALEAGASELSDLEERQLDELLVKAGLCPRALGSPVWQMAEASRVASLEMVEAQLHDQFDFLSSDEEMAWVRNHYGIGTSTAALSTEAAQAATAVRAITAGISRVVSVEIASGLDSHYEEWTRDHGPLQEDGFNLVARMIEELEQKIHPETGQSWLSHTTIIGFSEFTRTALLNVNGGRDHSLTGGCFLAGGNVQGGRVIGSSSDVGLEPTVTDLSTGETLANSEYEEGVSEVVNPEHILRALMVDAGVEEDEADWRVEPLSALFG